jgi:hypothetical protein
MKSRSGRYVYLCSLKIQIQMRIRKNIISTHMMTLKARDPGEEIEGDFMQEEMLKICKG